MSPFVAIVAALALLIVLCACSRWLASAVLAMASACVLGVVFAVAGLSRDSGENAE